MSMRLETIHQMTDVNRHRDAHDSADAKAIMTAARAFMLAIEEHTRQGPRQQRALAYADISMIVAVASIADIGG